jgi:hypothetical protein
LQEELLRVNRKVLGDDHPVTVTTVHNPAATLMRQGDHGVAQLQENVLQVSERTIAQDHPDALMAMENLGTTVGALGDLSAARISTSGPLRPTNAPSA